MSVFAGTGDPSGGGGQVGRPPTHVSEVTRPRCVSYGYDSNLLYRSGVRVDIGALEVCDDLQDTLCRFRVFLHSDFRPPHYFFSHPTTACTFPRYL